MNPKVILDYLEQKVSEHDLIHHDPGNGKKAYCVIDDPYDFSEFDDALRNCSSFPAVLAELVNGHLDDNDSANYTNSVVASIMVLDRPRNGESTRDAKSRCFDIGIAILQSIRKDVPHGIVAGKRMNFRINSNYQPVGPLDSKYWGYQFELSFMGSFSFC